jgi:hypothetical protein
MSNFVFKKRIFHFMMIVSVLLISGCAAMQPQVQPHEVLAPTPIDGNMGAYMCPYTSDGVTAEWVDKAINARMGAAVGQVAGAYAGQAALEQIPLVGGFLGSMAGEKIGREIAIKSCGGWEYIKSTSDLSFATVEDMAVYMFANYSTNSNYNEVFSAVQEIYPEFAENYHVAIQNAPKRY